MSNLIKPVYSPFQLTCSVASAIMVTTWALKVGFGSGLVFWLTFSLVKKATVRWLTRDRRNLPPEPTILWQTVLSVLLIHATQAATLAWVLCR
ncbi:MAG TPA: hypothetical protein VIM69_03580 [Opitutaceae bacterium]